LIVAKLPFKEGITHGNLRVAPHEDAVSTATVVATSMGCISEQKKRERERERESNLKRQTMKNDG